jgi:hypothetical protein
MSGVSVAKTKALLNTLLKGAKGDNAYIVAVSQGYKGTAKQWLASLKSTIPGPDGREVEFQKSDTHIQYKYTSETNWVNLVALADLTGLAGYTPQLGKDYFNGVNGTQIELQKTDTHIQWRYIGGSWANLIALTDITGPVQDITGKVDKITGSSLVADTEIAKIHASGSDNQDLSGLQPKESGKGLSENDLTDDLKEDYDTAYSHSQAAHAPSDANNYVHPSNHAPSIITQDTSNRFVTDAEKSTWNAKQPAGSYLVAADISGKADNNFVIAMAISL